MVGTLQNKKTGIITRQSMEYNYVWTPCFPMKELKFPRYSDKGKIWSFQIGHLVRVKICDNPDEEQNPLDIEMDEELQGQIHIIHEPFNPTGFIIMVHLGFPPEGKGYYEKELLAAKNLGCNAIAYCAQFGKIALFSDVKYKPAGFYTAFATRISMERNWMAEKVGTLFMIDTNKPLSEITDLELEIELYQRMPWKDHYVVYVNGNQPSQISNMNADNGTLMSTSNIWEEDENNHATANSNPAVTETGANAGHELNGRVRGVLDDFRGPNNFGTGHQQSISYESALLPNNLFGDLLATKLQWIHERSPRTAVCLKQEIINICTACKMEMLKDDKMAKHQPSTSNFHYF